MKRPSRNTPASIWIMPAISVAAIRPAMPWTVTTSRTRKVMAAAGPETWSRQPPRRATTTPPTTAVTRPTSGATPEALLMASDSGKATRATATAASVSARIVRGRNISRHSCSRYAAWCRRSSVALPSPRGGPDTTFVELMSASHQS